jgi:ATP-dependent DNA ligase
MAAFVAFDLLRLNGADLRQRPLEARREVLTRLIAKRRGDGIVFSEALAYEGAVVFAKACELGLEGIVSKRAGSAYKSGTSRNWLKTKNADFVRT